MEKVHIFLVEDDQSFGAVLKSYLELNDFEVTWVDDGKDAIDVFRRGNFQICILDVMLPHVDGFTLAGRIRKMNKSIPLLFLTAKTLKEDILKGYKLGADDYITKPFDTEVLLYKIKAILKRQPEKQNGKNEIYQIASYTFDAGMRTLTHDGITEKLSPKESALLHLLCQNKNNLLSREIALLNIWGDDGYFTARSMDVYMTKLRKYLSRDPRIAIKNIHGSGYILEVTDDAETA